MKLAQAHVISEAISSVLGRHRCEAVKAVRGEFHFHHAELYDLIADSGGPLAATARDEAARCRELGRSILGRVA